MASPFSGSSGRKAAMWTAGYLQQLQPQILDQLQQGKEEALGYYGQGREDVTGGYGEALTGLEKYYGQGAEAYGQAGEKLGAVQDRNLAGYDMLGNALGLGGTEGNAAARGAFQAGPGYEWATSQATQAADRRANRLGLLTSGNAQAATTELANNLANQEYGNWIKNLQPYQTASVTTGGQQANVLTGLGQLYGSEGKDYGTVRTDEAAKLAGLSGNEAALAAQTGESGANAIAGIGSQIAQVGQQGMQAGQQAAQNRMSAISGGIQAAGTILGGIAGGPAGAAIGSKAGNFFGGIFGGAK